jgi:hypothetical protein
MVCDGYTKVWDLAPDELVKLDGARGTTLRVTRGTLWITLEDDTRDVVLRAGDVFTIDRGGLTLVEAQGPATVCVMGRPIDEVHVHAGQPAPSTRARNWAASLFGADSLERQRFVPYA